MLSSGTFSSLFWSTLSSPLSLPHYPSLTGYFPQVPTSAGPQSLPSSPVNKYNLVLFVYSTLKTLLSMTNRGLATSQGWTLCVPRIVVATAILLTNIPILDMMPSRRGDKPRAMTSSTRIVPAHLGHCRKVNGETKGVSDSM